MGLVEGGSAPSGLAGALQQVNTGGLSSSAIQEAMSVSSPPVRCHVDLIVILNYFIIAAPITCAITCANTEFKFVTWKRSRFSYQSIWVCVCTSQSLVQCLYGRIRDPSLRYRYIYLYIVNSWNSVIYTFCIFWGTCCIFSTCTPSKFKLVYVLAVCWLFIIHVCTVADIAEEPPIDAASFYRQVKANLPAADFRFVQTEE